VEGRSRRNRPAILSTYGAAAQSRFELPLIQREAGVAGEPGRFHWRKVARRDPA
jgi:hypothetical protein